MAKRKRKRNLFKIEYMDDSGNLYEEIWKAARDIPITKLDCLVRKRAFELSDEFSVKSVAKGFF